METKLLCVYIEIAPPGNRTTNNTNSTNDSNNSSGSSSGNNNSNSNSISSSLPGWAIAVIVLAVVAIVCGAAALIWTIVISRRSKRNNKLIPIAGDSRNNHNNDNNEKRDYPTSINSQAKMTACRSTDSVPMTTASAAENASSIGSLASRRTFAQQQPLSPTYDTSINKLSSTEAVLLADTFRNTLGRSTADWNNSVTIGDEQEEELKRRRLGEALLQRQLEEDGTSVKHAGRFTRVKSLADIQKSAVFEQPKY